jgi:hypothetical protein
MSTLKDISDKEFRLKEKFAERYIQYVIKVICKLGYVNPETLPDELIKQHPQLAQETQQRFKEEFKNYPEWLVKQFDDVRRLVDSIVLLTLQKLEEKSFIVAQKERIGLFGGGERVIGFKVTDRLKQKCKEMK